MATLRRLLLIATLLGAVVGGYVFSVSTASLHAMPVRQLASQCSGAPIPC